MTIDHVIPRKHNGPNTWENVVTACSPCNLKKAARSPDQAQMKLLREPKPPQPNPYRLLQNQRLRDEWKVYIPAKEEVLIGGLTFLNNWILRICIN